MASTDGSKGDDVFSVVCGDLGLGQSTRSSIFLNSTESLLLSEQKKEGLKPPLQNYTKQHSKKILESRLNKNSEENISEDTFDSDITNKKRCSENSLSSKRNQGSFDEVNEIFPTYAEVPYGTSLRQQKKLYQQEVHNLRRQHSKNNCNGMDSVVNQQDKNSLKGNQNGSKLLTAVQEMEDLKHELEACRKKLEAKYTAVGILQQQAEQADVELKSTEKRFKEDNQKLQQEVSKLEFELEYKESSFLDSQQTWAERFDRVCQENAALVTKLEERNEELRRSHAHKTALERERDELLALLDVTERLKYEQGRSQTAQEEYETFSSCQLAVLGACKCRVSSPDPCGCAHAAASLRRDVVKLKEEIEENQRRREENSLTINAYRMAFEEQLGKSRESCQRLSHMASMTSRSSKAKAAFKFLFNVLKDDGELPPSAIEDSLSLDEVKEEGQSSVSLQEMVTVLSDMVFEKKEALAHQKMATQLIANKLQLLEKRVFGADVLPKDDTPLQDSFPQSHNGDDNDKEPSDNSVEDNEFAEKDNLRETSDPMRNEDVQSDSNDNGEFSEKDSSSNDENSKNSVDDKGLKNPSANSHSKFFSLFRKQ